MLAHITSSAWSASRKAIGVMAIGAAALATVSCAPAPRSQPGAASAAAAPGEILWDRYGVPHIFAPNAERLGYGFGYAQMHNHANLILLLYGQARGRGAEYWGEAYAESDRWTRRLGIPARAREWYAQQSPAFRRYLDAFAAGINAYAREHPAAIPDSLQVVLPVSAVDVLAHGQRVSNFVFIGNPPTLEAQMRRWMASGAPNAGRGGELGRAEPVESAIQYGSNAWAVAPAKSASGHAMLLANPHLPWGDLFTWMEVQLASPEIALYGATLVGSPVINIGFNDDLAWTHTVNTLDGADLYELTLDGAGYRFDGATRAFATHAETLAVKEPGGHVRREPMLIRRSVHGPVVIEKPGKALALRLVGLDRPGSAEEWWEMGRARSLAEFERALRRMQLPMFTVMYADRAGHILHLFNGQVPVRARGDAAYWSGIIPGDSSATLWTRTHPYDDLPKLVDPTTGWLQNANDPPWTTTFPLTASIDPARFPPDIAPRGMAMRPQRSAKLLLEGGALTFDELVRRKHDTRMELADHVLDDLLAATRERGSDAARRAAEVLARWDRTADAESRGGVLFAAWWRELGRRSTAGSPFRTPWSSARALETPSGLADPALAVAALDAAAAEMARQYGALDVPWGQVARLRRDTVDLPGNGGPGSLGIFRVIDYTGQPSAVASGGDSFVSVVEFSSPLRARALLGYGNASQPGSPHRVDQLPFVARKELRPVWRTKGEIEANLESRTRY